MMGASSSNIYCGKCSQHLSGKAVNISGVAYHLDCAICAGCSLPLSHLPNFQEMIEYVGFSIFSFFLISFETNLQKRCFKRGALSPSMLHRDFCSNCAYCSQKVGRSYLLTPFWKEVFFFLFFNLSHPFPFY